MKTLVLFLCTTVMFSFSSETKNSIDLGGGTDISVTLVGGIHEGTYQVSTAKVTCSMGLTGATSFGNQYSEMHKGKNVLSNVQLIVDNYEEAKKGTDKFYVKIGFGKMIPENIFEINGGDYKVVGIKRGKGKVTISESDNKKIANIEGQTEQGVSIKATITCMSFFKNVDGRLVEQH